MKTNKSISLEVELMEKVEKELKHTNESFTSLVERLLKAYLNSGKKEVNK